MPSTTTLERTRRRATERPPPAASCARSRTRSTGILHYGESMLTGAWVYVVALFALYAIATVASPAGVSGAVLLLPFQVCVLGTPSPAVTPTNLVYNVVATPGALYRYPAEQRLGRDEKTTPPPSREQPAERREDRSVCGSVATATMELTLEHPDLVAEHHQLDVLVQSCPSARSQQTEDPARDEVAQAEGHN